MIKGPKIEDRAEQPTLGIRTQVPMSELPKVIPELTGQVFAWMDKDPMNEPDPTKYETEVAIRLA